MNQKLTLGTVQFGLNYGISNKNGKVSIEEAESILDDASSNGITELDTAVAYGESEIVLGQLAKGRFSISTKLPKLDQDHGRNIRDWVKQQIESSLERLKIDQINTLFLHDSSILQEPYALDINEVIMDFKSKNLIKNFGLSIYSYHELERIPTEIEYQRIQCPVNVFDQSLIKSRWMSILAEKGIEIQARSIFLQGLLLMTEENRPTYFSKWTEHLKKWDEWLESNQMSPVLACIQFIKSIENVTNVVFGVDTLKHLKEIVSLFQMNSKILFPSDLASDDEELIFPFRWKTK